MTSRGGGTLGCRERVAVNVVPLELEGEGDWGAMLDGATLHVGSRVRGVGGNALELAHGSKVT